MSRRTITAALALSLAFGVTAPALAGSMTGTPATAIQATDTATSDNWSDKETEAALERFRELMPEATPELKALNAALGIDPEARAAELEQLIDGSQYTCGTTRLTEWMMEQTADWTRNDMNILTLLGVLEWSTYEALIYQPDGGPQVFGPDGVYTEEMTASFARLQKFWDVDGSTISLGAMNSDLVHDDAKMYRFFSEIYKMSDPEIEEFLGFARAYLNQDKFWHGNHPLFTFNAFAWHEDEAPEGRPRIEDKIIMGDGVLVGMAAIGLGDVAPRGILAHEYGHHVQMKLGLFDDHAYTPEATRETELEADAFAGYYLSHPRGERLRNTRVQAFVESFGQVGDCSFDKSSHHGTPLQRQRSAAWADELANSKGKKGHVLPSQVFSDLFRLALPDLVAPDA